MNRYYYDLHIQSCLSPCGDNDNTPANIAGMASLKGLQILALTDHNTCGNCPAFFKACKAFGIIPVPGMELTTAEDIHLVCLFPSLETAMDFDALVRTHRVLIPNRPAIFGDQLLMDENDRVIGQEEHLLINATDLSLEQAVPLVRQAGGVVYPAHIDREANGIIAVLGTFPEQPAFSCVEYYDKTKRPGLEVRFPILRGKPSVVSSDAHYLGHINEAENAFMLEDEPYSGDLVRRNLLALLAQGERL